MPAGPEPTMRTSISSGSSAGRSTPVPDAGSTRGSPETYPWWWNCIVVDSFPDGTVEVSPRKELFYYRTRDSIMDHEHGTPFRGEPYTVRTEGPLMPASAPEARDRKSTRLNSSH